MRLLEVTGLHEILDLLKARREFDRKMNFGKRYTRKNEEIIQDLWKGGVNVNHLTELMDESYIENS